MGFKRTSEGRIFFQGSDDEPASEHVPPRGANDEAGAPAPSNTDPVKPEIWTGHAMMNQQTQLQIVTLLKTLNERLKSTQAERNHMRKELEAYRTLVGDLERKTQQSEKAYVALEKRLSTQAENSEGSEAFKTLAEDALQEMEETRKMLLALEQQTRRSEESLAEVKDVVERHQKVGDQLLRKQSALEQFQHNQMRKMNEHNAVTVKLTQRVKNSEERQESLSHQVESAISEQARIGRRLDKAIEERARFMRKLERIEETALQTRDSLNAKAMVLLTDQHILSQRSAAIDIDEPSAADQVRVQEAIIRAHQDYPAPSLPSLETLKPYLMGLGVVALMAAVIALGYYGIKSDRLSFAWGPATPQSEQPPETQVPDTSSSWKIEKDTSAFAPAGPTSEDTASVQDAAKDLNTLSAADMAAMAPGLNDIEPGVRPAASAADISSEDAASDIPAPPELSKTIENPVTSIKPDRALDGAVKALEDKAFSGVGEAQHDLAAIYTAGQSGVQQNYGRARAWFEQAAMRGVANAAYNLGVLYHQGLGVQASIDKALPWYKVAADMGHAEAQYNLGIAYVEGIGVPYNPSQAVRYFTGAADMGIMEAAYNLGLIYENGLLGQTQPDLALKWYKTAADKGSVEARAALVQLSKSLNIDLKDINTLVENIDTQENPVVSSAQNARQELVQQVQSVLMDRGLYPGPADGINGPLTADAVRSYQRQNGLETDGQITKALLSHMQGRTL
ncbi:MAG: SEL1-like repeat protein [Alphaproteobacteria bacterium]|nr:SEL1-like repeat protein [Alphaproteobacteria bacterium]